MPMPTFWSWRPTSTLTRYGCPPVPLFRRIGIRTQSEIELERYALKALRGDFGPLAATVEPRVGEPARDLPERALRAVRR